MKSSFQFSNYGQLFFLIIIMTIAIASFSFPNAFAVIPDWNGVFYSQNDGGAECVSSLDVLVEVNDVAASGNDTIQVHITSSVDPVGFDLTLNEGPVGTFKNTNLALMSENGFVTTSSLLTITIFDDSEADPFEIQDLPQPAIRICSDSDHTVFEPKFTETGKDTNLFSTTINFDTTTNVATNTLGVLPGDVFTIKDGGLLTHGFVIPNPDVGKGAILTEVGGTVTATYQEDSSSILITPGDAGGRGTGGLFRPGLVVDNSNSESSESGGGCTNCTPPTLGLDSNYNRIVEQGFSFNGNAIDVEQYYTPYPLITANVGQENEIVLKIFDDGGTQNIEHVGLAFGLGKGQSFSESKATINLDRTLDGREKVSTFDPENVFDDVKIVTSKIPCSNLSSAQCLKVTIYQTFREGLEFNMVSTNVWDSKNNAWQNFYNHGIEVTGDSLNPSKTKMVAFGEKEMRGLFQLTEIDKRKHLWIDEFGNIYDYKGNERFDRILTVQNKVEFDKTTSHGCDRDCNGFIHYKLNQEFLAEQTLGNILDGKIIKGEPLKEPFSYSYKITNRAEDPELQKSIISEKIKAGKLVEKLLNPWDYPNFSSK